MKKFLIYVGVSLAWVFLAALIMQGSGSSRGVPWWVYAGFFVIWTVTREVLKKLDYKAIEEQADTAFTYTPLRNQA